MTPFQARLLVAGMLMLLLGVAFNALLLQRFNNTPSARLELATAPSGASQAQSLAPGKPQSAPSGLSFITGPARAPVDIKTAGLPQGQGEIDGDWKLWDARLKQLEAEAKGQPAPAAQVSITGVGQAPVDAPPAPVSPQFQEGSATVAKAPPVVKNPEIETRLAPVTTQTVRAIQRELAARGYEPGLVDGNIGLMTRAAIMAFEHDQGLPLTGEPSETLLRQVILGLTIEDTTLIPEPKARSNAEQLIKSVQQALASLNYAPGRADGLLSEETNRAIREFEMDQGLVPTGRVSGRLIVRLARQAGKAFTVPVP